MKLFRGLLMMSETCGQIFVMTIFFGFAMLLLAMAVPILLGGLLVSTVLFATGMTPTSKNGKKTEKPTNERPKT